MSAQQEFQQYLADNGIADASYVVNGPGKDLMIAAYNEANYGSPTASQGSGGGGTPQIASAGVASQGSGVQGILDALLAGNSTDRGLQQQTLQLQIDTATRNYQLAQNADQRQAALLDLQKAQQALSEAQFAEQKNQFAQNLTLEQRKQAAQESQFGQSQYSNLAQSLLGTATQLTGPRDYAKFQQYTSGGRDLMSQLYGSTPRPTYSAPTGQIEPMTLDSLMASLGLSGTGTAAPSAATPATQALPLPHQINPSVWDAMGSVGQQMVLGMAEKAGYDPNEFQSQLNAARPSGSAPKMTQYSFAQ